MSWFLRSWTSRAAVALLVSLALTFNAMAASACANRPASPLRPAAATVIVDPVLGAMVLCGSHAVPTDGTGQPREVRHCDLCIVLAGASFDRPTDGLVLVGPVAAIDTVSPLRASTSAQAVRGTLGSRGPPTTAPMA
jgi:hypothetical protein